ncbi:hypothetical protein [Paraburkholderia kururiensis]|uniref:hypothetical protein n=1 Tax=Paraburkholderia kururiensis TaxID=984307 RepID=UPI0005A70167|nr:hypothetical protein [Paraburkholderia kururiensis]
MDDNEQEGRALTAEEIALLNRHAPEGVVIESGRQLGEMVEVKVALPAVLPHFVISAMELKRFA